MQQARLRQFFGPSPRYSGSCIELTFEAPAMPVPLAGLERTLRQRIKGWHQSLPETLLPEKAIALVGQLLAARTVPAWTSHGRDGETAWAALGVVPPNFASALLVSLQRILLGTEAQRSDAWQQLDRLAELLMQERAINWNLIDAAQRQKIETAWIAPRLQVYQLGQGSRGLHFCQLANQRDSLTGAIFETSKNNTVELLQKLSLPTTRGVVVENVESAVKSVRTVGFPCVVKPLLLSKGKGVTTHITSEADLREVVGLTLRERRQPVLIENQVEGIDHRLLVLNNQVLWAYSKVPSAVVGDGSSTVRALIQRENITRDAVKDSPMTILEAIPVDAKLESFLWRRYQIGLDTVLEDRRRIEVAGESNISRGGILTDVTTQLHPDNRDLAVRVARYLRMNALGIDFMTPDISRSWKEVPCAIIEVNRTPGLSGDGDSTLAVRTIFSRRHSGHVPVLAAIGDSAFHARAGSRLVAAAQTNGSRVKLVEYRGQEGYPAVIAGERPHLIQLALLDPEADVLVVACDPEWVMERGFPLLRANLAVAQDPAALSFLDDVVDDLTDDEAIEEKVAAILADHEDEGAPIPVVTVSASEDGLRICCKRFGVTSREAFYRELGIASRDGHHMIEFSDVFFAIGQVANALLKRAGAAPLDGPIAYSIPNPAWGTVSVEGTVAVREDSREQTTRAVGAAIDRINVALLGNIAPHR